MSCELHSTDHCGVIATLGHDVASQDFQTGWNGIKNRGDFSAGLVTITAGIMQLEHASKNGDSSFPITHLSNIGSDADVRLGHNRYVTSGGSNEDNAQPFYHEALGHALGLVHNGNMPAETVSHLRLMLRSPMPEDASDSRIISQVLLQSRADYPDWESTIKAVLPHLQGSFSLILLTEDQTLYGIRDPWGIRPLCLGKKDNTWVLASESVAIDRMGATFIREIDPGEMVSISPDGSLISTHYAHAEREAMCLLEIIYFAKIDSKLKEKTYQDEHRALGRAAGRRFLKKEITVDHVIPILNSGKQMSVGVSEVMGMPNLEAISINTEERSFIQNTQANREETVYKKHVIDGIYVRGKRILLCDDSLVRGTSLSALVRNVKLHDPVEIHIVLGSEPMIDICDLGIDLPRPEDLLAYRLIQDRPDWDDPTACEEWLVKVEHAVAAHLGVDSVTYLDRESVNTALERSDAELCRHCFGGDHPISDHKRPRYRS